MNNQALLEYLSKHEEARTLTQQGIDQFNAGNLEEALLMFEESLDINPESIPALLYHSLCCFSLIQNRASSNLEGIAKFETGKYIQDMISSMERVGDLVKLMRSIL